jgi:hypothetical protein
VTADRTIIAVTLIRQDLKGFAAQLPTPRGLGGEQRDS